MTLNRTRLRKRMTECGLTNKQLAKAMNYSLHTVESAACGQIPISENFATIAAPLLGVTPEWLTGKQKYMTFDEAYNAGFTDGFEKGSNYHG